MENGVEVRTRVRRSVEDRRAELQYARQVHVENIAKLDAKLAALNGKTTQEKVAQVTKKWLEDMPVPALRAQALRVGIPAPESYEDLDELILTVLVAMGMAVKEDVPTHGEVSV